MRCYSERVDVPSLLYKDFKFTAQAIFCKFGCFHDASVVGVEKID